MQTERPDLFVFTADERAYLHDGQVQRDALLSPYATRDDQAIYEKPIEPDEDDALVRTAFRRDVDRVLNNAFYNRCMDKTQVFPFYKNDDLTRRSYHLQLVSSISRKLAQALRLNTALTEAIALAHDMGHTPFGHGGERFLSDLYHAHTGRYFNHNVHGARLLRKVATCNLSLQTYNGILCHCGEKAFERYEPAACGTFAQLDAMMERCYTVLGASQELRPSTLESCVVRICDILAYLGKDRQDALKLHVLDNDTYAMTDEVAGATNAQIISRVTANIIKNSIGKPYLAMDPEVFESLMRIKDDNSRTIYQSPQAHETLDEYIQPMMARLYERFREDVIDGNEDSYIFRHHINSWVMQFNEGYLEHNTPDDIVVDYLASMTDEYFIDLYNFLYPEDAIPEETLYHPYFH
jgi:dGTPase